jgi:L-amino acid N-acyltransferase
MPCAGSKPTIRLAGKDGQMIIRNATAADMPAVADLVNATIPSTNAAWTESLETSEYRAIWFEDQQTRANPILVADDDGQVIAFASYGEFRDSHKWPGYRYTVEHSVHVREAYWGQGVGRALIDGLIERALADGKHVMVAAIDGANDASIRLHERLGFTEVARMPEIGFKFGRWLDLVLMQRVLDPGATR